MAKTLTDEMREQAAMITPDQLNAGLVGFISAVQRATEPERWRRLVAEQKPILDAIMAERLGDMNPTALEMAAVLAWQTRCLLGALMRLGLEEKQKIIATAIQNK